MIDTQPELVEGPRAAGRNLFFAQIARLQDWPSTITAPDPHFVLFVAADVREVEDIELDAFARKLVDQGAACVCAWGPGCGRMHERFDWADIERNPDPDDTGVILTSAHAEESLDEALWYSLYVAWPAPKYESNCDATLAIVVGSEEWARALRQRLVNPDQIIDDLEPEERSPSRRAWPWIKRSGRRSG